MLNRSPSECILQNAFEFLCVLRVLCGSIAFSRIRPLDQIADDEAVLAGVEFQTNPSMLSM